MNRFSAATMVNITADSPPSYKAALLNVLQQGAASSGGAIIEWSPDGQKSGELRPDTALSGEHQAGSGAASMSDPTDATGGIVRSREFGNGGGEVDMLIGFFVMNGACIIFFLMFGMCVICNCMRKRPKFQSADDEGGGNPKKKLSLPFGKINSTANAAKTPNQLLPSTAANKERPSFVAPPPITSPSLRPTFKAIVARAMTQQQTVAKAAPNTPVPNTNAASPAQPETEPNRANAGPLTPSTPNNFTDHLTRRLSALSNNGHSTGNSGSGAIDDNIEYTQANTAHLSSATSVRKGIPSLFLRKCSQERPPRTDSSTALLNNNNPDDRSRVAESGASGATNYDDVVIFL
ncbi:hypothetical protein Ddc_19433 [Ditylenchus destructor]|nr:hypothetical protein Ddc_19433 [Ditylenchus destructor]